MLFIEFNDPVLLVLIAASIVADPRLFGPRAEDEPYGWIEAAAIMIAVFVVAIVTAGNDYSKGCSSARWPSSRRRSSPARCSATAAREKC